MTQSHRAIYKFLLKCRIQCKTEFAWKGKAMVC
jgi:hypothetical protein